MGADSSKEESRGNSPDQTRQRNQYVRPQRRQEAAAAAPAYQATYQTRQAPVERARPAYTTQHLQAAPSANLLERSRAPYNYSSDELQRAKPSNLYPNLNVNNAENGYVCVNYGQQRSTPQPSAPPAPVVNALPKTPARPPPPLMNLVLSPTAMPVASQAKASPKVSPAPPTSSTNAGPSQFANSSANTNRPRSATRNRGSTDSLSCPTCGQRLGLTIFQCATGHSCCKDCKMAERPCGDCLSPITNTRNIAVEALLAETKSQCRNSGCSLSFKPDEMERHLKECPFGEMDCPMGTFFGQCSTRCKVSDMAAHFDEHHKEQRTAIIDKEMFVSNICMEAHKMYLIKNGNFTFLVHLKVGERDRKISMTVQLLGTKISAEKWTYEFHVYNKRQPMRKYLYVDKCKSISTPIDDIFNGYQCATLPLTYAMTFVNESCLTYKFFIKKDMNQHARRGGPRNNAAR